MNIKISVIIPSFNQARYLEATLLSVISQEYQNLELIVVDGGSTDESVEIIKTYDDQIDYWVSEPDGGQTKGLIKGFEKSTGDIQCWLNSDDLHEEGALKTVAEYFSENPDVDAVYGDTTWIDSKGKVIREQREIPFNWFIWMYTHNYIPGMSMFWRSQLYRDVGGLDPEFDLAMDADLWARFNEKGRIEHIKKRLSRMRFYAEQKNIKYRERSNDEDLIIRRRYWRSGTPRLLKQKQWVAQVWRILWRLISGCYSISYKRHMEG